MSAKAFVDTNILVYSHDLSAGLKHQRARDLMEQLWLSGGGVLSTQVLQELCVSLQRKVARPWPIEEIRLVIEDYKRWEVVVNTPESILEALSIETRYRISFWDALILSAAATSGATTLYSEDLSSGRDYGSVKVVNPLIDSPAE